MCDCLASNLGWGEPRGRRPSQSSCGSRWAGTCARWRACTSRAAGSLLLVLWRPDYLRQSWEARLPLDTRLSLSLSLSLSLFLSLYVCLYVCLSVCLSLYLFLSLSFSLSLSLGGDMRAFARMHVPGGWKSPAPRQHVQRRWPPPATRRELLTPFQPSIDFP